MCPLRCGPVSGSAPPSLRRAAARGGVIGLLLALTACAPSQNAQQAVHNPPFPGDTPPVYMAEARPPRVEIEADGLPAQLAPRERKPQVDDPREPWSPNYGTVRPSQTTAVPAPIPVALASPQRMAIFRPQPIDEDDVIRRAITEHEMRQED